MKIKKLVTLIILSLSAALAFTSCSDDDGYSLDKFWLEFGTIEKTSDQDYKIILDKGPILFPSVSNVPVRYLENKMRVYADFTILQDANPGSTYKNFLQNPSCPTPKRSATAWAWTRLNYRNTGLPMISSPSVSSMPEGAKLTW